MDTITDSLVLSIVTIPQNRTALWIIAIGMIIFGYIIKPKSIIIKNGLVDDIKTAKKLLKQGESIWYYYMDGYAIFPHKSPALSPNVKISIFLELRAKGLIECDGRKHHDCMIKHGVYQEYKKV